MWAIAYFTRVFDAELRLDSAVKLYVPRGVKMTKPGRKSSPVESTYPLFGNMMFVDYEEEIYTVVRSTIGFKRFLKIGGQVAFCREGEVERIMEDEQEGLFRWDYKKSNIDLPLMPGNHVSIIDRGPLSGEGIVTKVSNTTIKVHLTGWNYELTLSSCNVQLASI